MIIKAAKETKFIVTCEEHSVIGGLSDAVSSVVCEECPTKVLRVGVNDVFGQSGPALEVLKLYGLSKENIIKVVKEGM